MTATVHGVGPLHEVRRLQGMTATIIVAAVVGCAIRLLAFDVHQYKGIQEHAWFRGAAGWGGTVAFAIGVALLLRAAVGNRWIAKRIGQVGGATQLGAMRAVVCLALGWSVYIEQIGSTAGLPMAHRYALGWFDLLLSDRTDAVLRSYPFLVALKTGALLFCGLAMLGWRTRFTLPVAALSYLLLGGVVRSMLTFTHDGLAPLYLAVLLCFMPCADALSLDRRQGRTTERPREHYGWAVFAIWLAFATVYLACGLSKLRNGGLDWWHATNMQSFVFKTAFKPYSDQFIDLRNSPLAPAWLFAAAGLFTLITEIGMIATPFSRRARIALPIMAVALHVGIRVLQQISFWDVVILQAMFVNWDWVGRRLGAARLFSPQDMMPTGSPCRWQPLAACALPFVLLVGWAHGIEQYPLSSMAMYAGNNRSGVLEYYLVVQTDSAGRQSRAWIDQLSPETKVFHMALWHTFSAPAARARSVNLLRYAGEEWNRHARADRQIASLAIELWRWDYAHHLADPQFGQRVARIEVPLNDATVTLSEPAVMP